MKLQIQQMTEHKQCWVESQTELVKQLKTARKEAKEAVEAKHKAEKELRDILARLRRLLPWTNKGQKSSLRV